MEKIDLKKQMKHYWQPPAGKFVIVDVPELSFAMIDGAGDLNTSPVYANAVGWLYTLSYTLKFMSKAAGRDYGVAPLEGLWWSDDMATFTTERDKSRWSWTMMSLVPAWIHDDHLERARRAAAEKADSAAVGLLRWEELSEGLCVQTLHLGSYDDEAPVLADMHERFIPGEGLRMRGRHHEIYRGDPRRTAPEKLRTILRQPVERVG